ncbi:MAG: hypothetical protein ACRDBG_11455 [Waterburya sp.]
MQQTHTAQVIKQYLTEEIRQRIIQGRIKHLENEIKTFPKNINDIIGE